VRVVVELVESSTVPETAGVLDGEARRIGVERDRVGGVGLQLDRVCAGIRSGVDDLQRTLERVVVVPAHLGDDEGWMARADGTTCYQYVAHGAIP